MEIFYYSFHRLTIVVIHIIHYTYFENVNERSLIENSLFLSNIIVEKKKKEKLAIQILVKITKFNMICMDRSESYVLFLELID